MVVAGCAAVPWWISRMLKFRGSWFLFVSVVFAQTPDTATIQGQVTDVSRAAVPGVHIAARNQENGLERTALTDAAGNYSLPGLPVAGASYAQATIHVFHPTLPQEVLQPR